MRKFNFPFLATACLITAVVVPQNVYAVEGAGGTNEGPDDEPMVTRIYTVRDIVYTVPDFPFTGYNLPTTNGTRHNAVLALCPMPVVVELAAVVLEAEVAYFRFRAS